MSASAPPGVSDLMAEPIRFSNDRENNAGTVFRH
jgi:hypothetical protein